MTLGTLGLPFWRFMVLNLLGAATWAALFAMLGYQFGNAMQWVFDDLRVLEEAVLLGLLVAGIGWTILRRWRR